MFQNVRTGNLWLLLLLTVLWLPASADMGAELPTELPKAVVTLNPPWINVLQKDAVMLHCQGPHTPEDPKTHWFHNGSSLDTQGQASLNFRASSKSSGNYSCQTDRSLLSDPVQLTVVSDWLLLQTTTLQFQEGDPIVLRCHSWQNRPLVKVALFQDGQAKTFSHYDQKFSIPQANLNHSGEYHCQGYIGRKMHTSQPVTIAIQGHHQGASSLGSKHLMVSPLWLHIVACLTIVLLFAVDTGLYLSLHSELGKPPGSLGISQQCFMEPEHSRNMTASVLDCTIK